MEEHIDDATLAKEKGAFGVTVAKEKVPGTNDRSHPMN